MATCSVVHLKDIDMKDRIDAEYFQPEFLQTVSKLGENSPSLETIAKPITSAFYPAATQLYSIGEVPFIRCVDVIDYPVISSLQNNEFEKLPSSFIRENKTIKKLNSGDIVITKVGTPCYASVIDESLEEISLSRTVLGLTDIKIDPYYLVAFLRSKYGFLQLKRECELTIQLQLTLHRVGRIKVFVPSDEEQIKGISSLVKEYFEFFRASRSLYEKAQNLLLEELRIKSPSQYTLTYTASLSNCVENNRMDPEFYRPEYEVISKKIAEIAEKNSWEIKTIKEISEPLKYGTSEKLTYLNKGIPFLRITDVQDMDFDRESLCNISEEQAKKVKYAEVKEGDLVISRSGTLGLTIPIRKDLENSIFGSYFIRVRPKTTINRDYLSFYLNSFFGQIQVKKTCTGALQTNLTIPIIENMKLVIPSPDFQERIAKLLVKMRQLRERAKAILKDAKIKVETKIEQESNSLSTDL